MKSIIAMTLFSIVASSVTHAAIECPIHIEGSQFEITMVRKPSFVTPVPYVVTEQNTIRIVGMLYHLGSVSKAKIQAELNGAILTSRADSFCVYNTPLGNRLTGRAW